MKDDQVATVREYDLLSRTKQGEFKSLAEALRWMADQVDVLEAAGYRIGTSPSFRRNGWKDTETWSVDLFASRQIGQGHEVIVVERAIEAEED